MYCSTLDENHHDPFDKYDIYFCDIKHYLNKQRGDINTINAHKWKFHQCLNDPNILSVF